VNQALALDHVRCAALEIGKAREVSLGPRIESLLATFERDPPAVHREPEEIGHRVVDRDGRRRQVATHLLHRRHDHVQVLVGPWLIRMTAVDVLEAQRHPTLFVERPQQPRRWGHSGKGGQDLRLPAMDAGRVGIRRLAHGLEKDAPVVGEAKSSGQAWRKAGWLGRCLDDSRAKAFLERVPDVGRDVLPMDSNTFGRKAVRERRLSGA